MRSVVSTNLRRGEWWPSYLARAMEAAPSSIHAVPALPDEPSFVSSSIHAVPALPDEATSSARAGSSLEVIKQTDENTARGPDGNIIGTHTVIIIRLNYAGREIASWKGSLRHDCDGDLIEAHGTTDYELATDRSTLTLVRADGQRRTMPLNIERV